MFNNVYVCLQRPQAGGEHPVVHRPAGLWQAHRLLAEVAVRRRPAGPRQEEEPAQGPGWRRHQRRGGGLNNKDYSIIYLSCFIYPCRQFLTIFLSDIR
jgi:hypothetical protein